MDVDVERKVPGTNSVVAGCGWEVEGLEMIRIEAELEVEVAVAVEVLLDRVLVGSVVLYI